MCGKTTQHQENNKEELSKLEQAVGDLNDNIDDAMVGAPIPTEPLLWFTSDPVTPQTNLDDSATPNDEDKKDHTLEPDGYAALSVLGLSPHEIVSVLIVFDRLMTAIIEDDDETIDNMRRKAKEHARNQAQGSSGASRPGTFSGCGCGRTHAVV